MTKNRLDVETAQYIVAIEAEACADALAGRRGLDEAWAAVEAALPEGHSFSVSSTVGVSSGPFVAVTDYGDPANAYAYADTPAAALWALAERLR